VTLDPASHVATVLRQQAVATNGWMVTMTSRGILGGLDVLIFPEESRGPWMACSSPTTARVTRI
jgi:hypothetical protein